ncbi:MAG: hypothetical protein IPN03_13800 [Holophagales bacterium]|nr:hypothetical protein [Holophagales bacterium]
MRPNPPHLALALALGALIAFPLTASETRSAAGEKPAAPATEAAMKIHVDPATGQVVSPRSDPGAARSATSAGATEAARPLRVEKVTTRAGGKKVNLQGRFMMEMAATASADGKVSGTCNATEEAGPKAPAPAKEHRHDR